MLGRKRLKPETAHNLRERIVISVHDGKVVGVFAPRRMRVTVLNGNSNMSYGELHDLGEALELLVIGLEPTL